VPPGLAVAQQHRPARKVVRAAAPQPFDVQVLAAQVALDRAGFSPGEIDGKQGSKTTLALEAYKSASKASLDNAGDPLTTYTITEQDSAGPFEPIPSDMMEQSKLQALGYSSLLEMLGERFHASPAFLRQLNPSAAWKAGESVKVPNVEPFEIPSKAPAAPSSAERGARATSGERGRGGRAGAARGEPQAVKPPSVEVVLTGSTKSLMVRDSTGKVLMFAPVTTGSEHDPLPIGEWKVMGVSWNPVFNYNPNLFWDANPVDTKAKLAAGPNNPVGVVWVDINKEHYGLHGTPEPSTIGRTESHGCIRLTNWDATKLGRLVSPGTKVVFQ